MIQELTTKETSDLDIYKLFHSKHLYASFTFQDKLIYHLQFIHSLLDSCYWHSCFCNKFRHLSFPQDIWSVHFSLYHFFLLSLAFSSDYQVLYFCHLITCPKNCDRLYSMVLPVFNALLFL